MPIKTVKLSDKTVEAAGWLFSCSLGVCVREHETDRKGWDIEIECYKSWGQKDVAGPWGPDTDTFYPACKTVAEAIAANPELGRANDWVSGDSITFV